MFVAGARGLFFFGPHGPTKNKGTLAEMDQVSRDKRR